MNWVRRSFVHLLASLLFISLLGMAAAVNFNLNFSQPDKLKTWLSESKIYDQAATALLDKSQSENNTSGGSSISLENPGVKQAADEAFSPQLLKTNAEKIIDANYDWLSGKTNTPTFSVDFASSKDEFANKVGRFVEDNLSKLAACTPAQQAQLQIPIDPLTAPCRPAGINPKTEGERITQEVKSGKLLSQPVITADSLGRDQTGADNTKPYYQNLSKAPQLFQLGKILPYVLAAIALILCVGIIFLSVERRQGFRRIGAVLFTAGVSLVVTKFVADSVVNRLNRQVVSDAGTAAIQKPTSDLLKSIESQLTQTNLIFGIVFLALALAIFIYLFTTRQSKSKPKPPKATPAPTLPANPEPSEQPQQSQKIDPSNFKLTPRNNAGGPTTAPEIQKPKRPRLIQ